MAPHYYRLLLVICLFLVEQLVCLKNGAKPRKVRISPQFLATQNNTLLEPMDLNPQGQQQPITNLLQTLPSRSDNRIGSINSIMDNPVQFRSKPMCNKRIRIANGVTRFRERGSLVRYACSHGFVLLGATLAVCLRDEWSEPPPICVRPGCRRVLAPNNGVARLTYSGAVADFLCKIDYKLEGSRVLYCDGHKWNDSEPICISIHPLTTSTTEGVWEWPQPTTTEEIISPKEEENLESWDNNTPNSSTEYSNNVKPASSQENSLSPLLNHDPSTDVSEEAASILPPLLNRAVITPSQTEDKNDDDDAIFATTGELTFDSTTEKLSITEDTHRSVTIESLTITPEVIKTTTNKQDEPTTPPPEMQLHTETEIMPKFQDSPVPTTATSESWEEPFPDNTFDKFDQELEAGSNTYETNESSLIFTPPTTRRTMPEFIQPISPHKLDDDGDHEFYKKWAHVSIVGGIVLGILGGMSLVGGTATYCWRKKVGIARAHQHDQDGRTLSASDANDDFMWVDSSNISRDHQRMSRL